MTTYSFENLEAACEPRIYEDGISNRQRRAMRGQSAKDRLSAVRSAQSQSNTRVRIARPVKNQPDFSEELKVWIAPVQEGLAQRKSLGNLAMTVFDTTQQPLRYSDDLTEENLRKRLENRDGKIFEKSPPIEVTGTGLFGNMSCPFIGLTLAPGFVHEERKLVRAVVAPELALDDSHHSQQRLHVSLGQAFTYERALAIQAALASVLPAYVQFKPATVSVEYTLNGLQ